MGNRPTPLRKAVRWNDVEKVEQILAKAGDDAPHLINDDYSPDCLLESCSRATGNAFYYACFNNRLKVIEVMLAKGADIHSVGYCGETCLHAAARHNYVDTARILVKHGCDVHATDDQGRYPLHCVGNTIFNTAEMIKFLLEEAGTPEDVNSKDFNGRTPLHEAVYSGHVAAVETLIGYGADVNAKSNEGNTPLHAAKKQPQVWQVLVEKGADVNAVNNNGLTPSQMPD